ncbi:hypothetical protein TNCV_855051 [Trichonephila clavipes]|nr:hypothetical protein TNCV_855051 [Trichonephila clavipes]
MRFTQKFILRQHSHGNDEIVLFGLKLNVNIVFVKCRIKTRVVCVLPPKKDRFTPKDSKKLSFRFFLNSLIVHNSEDVCQDKNFLSRRMVLRQNIIPSPHIIGTAEQEQMHLEFWQTAGHEKRETTHMDQKASENNGSEMNYGELNGNRNGLDVYEEKRQWACNNLVALHFKYDQARRRFVEWAQNEIAVVPDFHKRILFSDEAHFWLNGYVNKKNCRIWSEANPQVYVETPLHPKKLTVWCALWAGEIIGPCFFKNDDGHNVTVNGDRYRAMITNFFILELNNHDFPVAVVPTRRRNMSQSSCHNRFIERHVW